MIQMPTTTRRRQYRIGQMTLAEINRVLQDVGLRMDQVDAVAQNPDIKGRKIINLNNGVRGSDAIRLDQISSLMNGILQDNSYITWSYDAATKTITGQVSLSPFDTGDLSEGSNLYFTEERVDDRVNGLLVPGTNISLVYDDALNTLTVSATTGITQSTVLLKTGSYTILETDLGKSIRMNAATDEIFTFPSVNALNDGVRLRIGNLGAGRLTLQMVDSDKIIDSSATGTCYTDDQGATMDLEYCHTTETWLPFGAYGAWTTT